MDGDVEIRIAPEPADEVRHAILAAFEQLDDESRESAWWRAGIVEALAAEPE